MTAQRVQRIRHPKTKKANAGMRPKKMSVKRLSQSGSEATGASAVAANKDMSAAINATPWLSTPQRSGGAGAPDRPTWRDACPCAYWSAVVQGHRGPLANAQRRSLPKNVSGALSKLTWSIANSLAGEAHQLGRDVQSAGLVLGLVRSIRSGRFRHQLQNCACRIQRIPRSPSCAAIVAKWRLRAHLFAVVLLTVLDCVAKTGSRIYLPLTNQTMIHRYPIAICVRALG
jgi:hypothetical protein